MPSSLSLTRHRLLRRLSYSSSAADTTSSHVYQHKLKFQKPATIKYTNQAHNSASFIGTIAKPLQQCHTKTGTFGVYTSLRLRSNSPYVQLKMWREMAEVAMEHLKLDDFVYVSGCLRSFTIPGDCSERVYYDLSVTEINFVTPMDQEPASTMSRSVDLTDEDQKDKYRMKLHLWQVFFSNPIEWRDFRTCKKNPRQPDFRHKDTGECLWLNHDDPPWIQRQIQLLDSRMGGLNFQRHRNSSSMVPDLGNYI